MNNSTEEIEKQTESLLNKFNLWRRSHISERQFILLLSLMVGVFTAFAAILLKYLISLIHGTIYGNLVMNSENYSLLLYPVVGILVSGLFIRLIVRDDIGHGVTKILYALSKKNGRIISSVTTVSSTRPKRTTRATTSWSSSRSCTTTRWQTPATAPSPRCTSRTTTFVLPEGHSP